MKELIANMLLGALRLASKRGYCWLMDPARQARIRMAHRRRWWKRYLKAKATRNKYDDMAARAYAIQFNFETTPQDAEERGDLDVRPCH